MRFRKILKILVIPLLVIGGGTGVWYKFFHPKPLDDWDWSQLQLVEKEFPKDWFSEYKRSTAETEAQLSLQLEYLSACMKKTIGDDRRLCELETKETLASLEQIKEERKNILPQFKKEFIAELTPWVERVTRKVQMGLYSSVRSGFYLNILDLIDKNVLSLIEDTPLVAHENFVDIVKNYSPPAKQLKFEDRFTRPQYAQEYKNAKLDYHQWALDEYRRKRHDTEVVLDKLPDEKDAQTEEEAELRKKTLAQLHFFETEIAFHTSALEKWKTRDVPIVKRNAQITPMDRLMGVAYLKDKGLSGNGVEVGVIDAPSASENQTHRDIRDHIASGSKGPRSVHGTHVTGIVVARAREITDRLGVADRATVTFIPFPEDGNVIVTYYQNGRFKTFKALGISRVTGQLVDETKGAPKALDNFLSQTRSIAGSYYSPKMDSLMAKRIDEMRKRGIEVINASFSMSLGPKTIQSIKRYHREGGVIVVAAGNDGEALDDRAVVEPGEIHPVSEYQKGIDVGLIRVLLLDEELRKAFIFVGSLATSITLTDYSSRAGELPDRYIAAWGGGDTPGSGVVSTVGEKGRVRLSGTSMAAPMVTGSIAMLKEAFPDCSGTKLAQVLLDSATPIGEKEEIGKGRLNLRAAYGEAKKACK